MEIVEKVCEKSKPGVLYNYFKQAISHLRLDSFFIILLGRKLRGTVGLSSSIWRLWTMWQHTWTNSSHDKL